MDKRALILGLGTWFTLFGLGLLWVSHPPSHPPSNIVSGITPDQVARAFKIRLTPLPEASADGMAQRPFDYMGWALGESRKRFHVFLVTWIALGYPITWVAGRIYKKKPAPPKA